MIVKYTISKDYPHNSYSRGLFKGSFRMEWF